MKGALCEVQLKGSQGNEGISDGEKKYSSATSLKFIN
jgi:hypothetical protein